MRIDADQRPHFGSVTAGQEVVAYIWRMMKEVGHNDVELIELQGYDHGGMAKPAFPLLVKVVKARAGAVAK